MKQAGRVRRPFHAQALAIIQLCRTLVNAFREESHHTADNILPLEECVELQVIVAIGSGLSIDMVPFT
jgi:hypothetical protein